MLKFVKYLHCIIKTYTFVSSKTNKQLLTLKFNKMKAIKLSYATKDFNGNQRNSGTTASRIWNEDFINSELNELLEDKNIETATLDGQFLKSDFNLDEVENILGIYGEIDDETEDYYSINWVKSNEDRQIKLDRY